ncbi:hypothetical protein [Georgenia thermotolerans]|uniref:DUF1330 domain-containing protein n=1 Tax=Georgenia thermotolerans TaxID=527326 RepID=A0A7J5UUN6_9MICO|nr:hypothetical protein [Georgenia thermotolerans]KAE8765987.1 hypothetical protein GB883_00830 [Georgenia thermotolerans]
MPTILVFHEIEDADRWLKSPKREELFGPLGYTVRTFVDPTDAHRAGLIIEGPALDVFEQFMKSDAAADAMKHDGVRADTVRVLLER